MKNQIQILNGEVTNRPEPLPFGNRGNRAVFLVFLTMAATAPPSICWLLEKVPTV
jgi:hypothetical protein